MNFVEANLKQAIFFHDHKIYKKDDSLLSRGGLSPLILNEYRARFGCLTICSRELQSPPKDYVVLASEGVNHVIFPDVLGKDLFQFREAYKIVEKTLQNDSFTIVRLPSISGLFACWLSRKSKQNLIIEVVGCSFDSYWHYGNLKGKLLAPIMYLAMRYFVSKGDNVSYVTKEFLQKRYPTKAKNILSVSDVTINIDEQVIFERINRLHKLPLNKINLGMIGNYEIPYKGYYAAFKALDLLESKNPGRYSLSLVGGGNDKDLRQMVSKLGLNECVHFLGVKSYPQGVFNWLDEIDIFLQPSKVEGLPRALIEAMSRGCAALGSSVGGIPELLNSEFIVKPNDFNRLAKLIDRLSVKSKLIDASRQNFNHARDYDIQKLSALRSDFHLKLIQKCN